MKQLEIRSCKAPENLGRPTTVGIRILPSRNRYKGRKKDEEEKGGKGYNGEGKKSGGKVDKNNLLSSQASPALHIPDPISMTKAGTSSSI
jgi:hypothetical protein